MGDRFFPNTMSDYVVSLRESDERDKKHSQTEDKVPEHGLPESNLLLKEAIALKDEVSPSSAQAKDRHFSSSYNHCLLFVYICFGTFI